jgi:hypothetical protein
MYYSPCKLMYLEQNDNHSFFTYLPLVLFYSAFGYYSIKFINHLNNKNKELEYDEINKKKNYKYQSNFLKKQDLENPDSKNSIPKNEEKITKFTSINLDEKIDPSLQKVFDNILSSKTLERALVIYYIFIKKGNYKVKVSNAKSNDPKYFEEYNSYLEFKKYDNYYSIQQQIKDLDNPDFIDIEYEVNNLFNLDKDLDTNKNFFIGEKEYNINEGNFNIIMWIYYSGLYDYLTTNIELKNKILKEMYEDNLLTGNLFLRYQMQLL